MKRIQEAMMDKYEEFQNRFGIGPCGNIAAVLRKEGLGQIAVCDLLPEKATNEEQAFPHYIIEAQDGKIIDITNPLEGRYLNVKVLGPDETPDLVDKEALGWLRKNVLEKVLSEEKGEGVACYARK